MRRGTGSDWTPVAIRRAVVRLERPALSPLRGPAAHERASPVLRVSRSLYSRMSPERGCLVLTRISTTPSAVSSSGSAIRCSNVSPGEVALAVYSPDVHHPFEGHRAGGSAAGRAAGVEFARATHRFAVIAR